MALNYGGSPYFNTQSAPMFPQPNGNVYLIQNSLEVANIPTSGGLATVIAATISNVAMTVVRL